MNITMEYSLNNLIKMENCIHQIIKGPAKLSVAHWFKVLVTLIKFTGLFYLQNIISDTI
jgi:hypothetical protein